MLGLKIFITIVSIYGSVRLAGIAMEWLRVLFEELKPGNRDRY